MESGTSVATVAAGEPRVRAAACVAGLCLERDLPEAEIARYIEDRDNVVWVDVQDPGPAELSLLLEEFDFHPLALEDVAKGQQRPKADEYRGYTFFVTYSAIPAGTAAVRTAEVNLFIGRNYMVTVHRGPVPALEEAYGRWTRGGQMLREGVGFLVYCVMDAIIDAYFPVLAAIESEVDSVEEAMFARTRKDSVQVLLEMKRRLFLLRRVLHPLRETFNLFLRRDQPLFSPNTIVYFQDVYDHILRLLDALETEREMVTSALEAHLMVISNRLNERMETLTVVSVVLGTVGCAYGAWGMNVRGLPPVGFGSIIVGTLVFVVAALLFSWRRRWI